MGYCQYCYNPSEQYQLQHPGAGIETSCGRPTYPAVDEPELFPVTDINGVTVMRETGRLLPRAQHDPYCPYHGGSPEPPPPPVSQAELQVAYTRYRELAQRYEGQAGGAMTASVPAPAEITASDQPIEGEPQ
jgi:hypothetical protein